MRHPGCLAIGFYAWQKRPASKTALHRQTLLEKIRVAHVQSRCAYGSSRVEPELAEQGIEVCVNTAANTDVTRR